MSWEFESQQSVFECFWSLDRPVIFMGHTNAIIACLSTREMAVSKMWYPPKHMVIFITIGSVKWFWESQQADQIDSPNVFPSFSQRNRWHLGQGRNTKVESTRGSRGAGRAWTQQIGMVFPQRMVMDGAPVMWTLVYSRIWFTVW